MDWAQTLTLIGSIAAIAGLIYTFMRNFKLDIQNFRKDMDERFDKMDKKFVEMDQRVTETNKRMDGVYNLLITKIGG